MFTGVKVILIFIKWKCKKQVQALPIYLRPLALREIHLLFNPFQINLSLHLIRMYQARLKENSMVLYLDERLKEVLIIKKLL